MKQIMVIGSCLSFFTTYRNGAERLFSPQCMIRFHRIDALNSYLVEKKERDPLEFFSLLELDARRQRALEQQYLGKGLGASFDSKTIIQHHNDFLHMVKNTEAIIMDTFFDQRVKLVRKKGSDTVPAFIKVLPKQSVDPCKSVEQTKGILRPSRAARRYRMWGKMRALFHPFAKREPEQNIRSIESIDQLSPSAIQKEYRKWSAFIASIHPQCKLIVFNFTGLDYLHNEKKLQRLRSIDDALSTLAAGNFYFVKHQNFSPEYYDGQNGTKTVSNHLALFAYQKYISLLSDIIDDICTTHLFDENTIVSYPNKFAPSSVSNRIR